ncbi:mannose-1-phosphate guanylyltransferase [Paenibacillus flagellatus]|uniref:Mannose-1-phosphate guanylyltransferase n=1 Tax=Paenibacillus flagellatus TaxID=2211139 RepID=A0A2V5JZ62_9BACL|nr:mannose-1-phosphate guanylyltransferase [Paenibacillus flagellatus]PYI52118.1 mannose-1-phosphate guanylyltransferase [Paenibacillus flagellatus]
MKIVIMAGGKGNRFWPRSVEGKPKQFLALTSEETMLQLTYRRFAERLPAGDIYVVTAERYRALVMEQLPELDESNLICEPDQRDTGPCVALTAQRFLRLGEDDVLVTMPSDHHIPHIGELFDVLRKAEPIAARDRTIVTLGITPTRPETNYGYIEAAADVSFDAAHRVRSFIEKPDIDKARRLLKTPNVYWNSGIFIWKPSTIAHYMRQHQPDMWNALQGSEEEVRTAYADLPKLSVDYAILEKAEHIYNIPVRFEWDDLGSWTSLERIREADADGNIVHGDVYATESKGSIIFAEDRRTVVIGASDLIIVSTAEGLLVCHKSQEHAIKSMVQRLEQHEGGMRE